MPRFGTAYAVGRARCLRILSYPIVWLSIVVGLVLYRIGSAPFAVFHPFHGRFAGSLAHSTADRPPLLAAKPLSVIEAWSAHRKQVSDGVAHDDSIGGNIDGLLIDELIKKALRLVPDCRRRHGLTVTTRVVCRGRRSGCSQTAHGLFDVAALVQDQLTIQHCLADQDIPDFGFSWDTCSTSFRKQLPDDELCAGGLLGPTELQRSIECMDGKIYPGEGVKLPDSCGTVGQDLQICLSTDSLRLTEQLCRQLHEAVVVPGPVLQRLRAVSRSLSKTPDTDWDVSDPPPNNTDSVGYSNVSPMRDGSAERVETDTLFSQWKHRKPSQQSKSNKRVDDVLSISLLSFIGAVSLVLGVSLIIRNMLHRKVKSSEGSGTGGDGTDEGRSGGQPPTTGGAAPGQDMFTDGVIPESPEARPIPCPGANTDGATSSAPSSDSSIWSLGFWSWYRKIFIRSRASPNDTEHCAGATPPSTAPTISSPQYSPERDLAQSLPSQLDGPADQARQANNTNNTNNDQRFVLPPASRSRVPMGQKRRQAATAALRGTLPRGRLLQGGRCGESSATGAVVPQLDRSGVRTTSNGSKRLEQTTATAATTEGNEDDGDGDVVDSVIPPAGVRNEESLERETTTTTTTTRV
ncbi:MAG: hypothetical protein M1815_003469 [Lichina confinis]|nr:MAG: hypothetical protein M1815_003469 [Lichina confinis]